MASVRSINASRSSSRNRRDIFFLRLDKPTGAARKRSKSSLASFKAAMFVSKSVLELLDKVTTGGVSVGYRFTRHPHLYSPKMVAVELTFTNHSTEEVPVIKLGSKSLPPGMSLHEFPAVSNIPADQSRTVTLGVDYKDTTQAAKFDIVIDNRPFTVALSCPMGELVRPLNLPLVDFDKEQVGAGEMGRRKFDIKIFFISVQVERNARALCQHQSTKRQF